MASLYRSTNFIEDESDKKKKTKKKTVESMLGKRKSHKGGGELNPSLLR